MEATAMARGAALFACVATLPCPQIATAHSVPSEEHKALVQSFLDDVAVGQTSRLWFLLDDHRESVIPRPTSREEAEAPATPEQIEAYPAVAQDPENAHGAAWDNTQLKYPCAHLLHPGSAMRATKFGVSGNNNGVLIGGAEISVEYPVPETSPVVFVDHDKTEPLRLRSVALSVMYTADVGDPNILDPKGWYFAMDKDNCQIMDSTGW